MAAATRPLYLAAAAACGLLFGAGLHVSQMVDPLKVLRFLDFGAIPSGGWDPSLALVMAAGLAVMLVAIRLSARRPAPLLDTRFHTPEYTHIDLPLVAGSALFGIGWGMTGVCPGPAVALIAFGPENLLVLLVSIIVGSLAGSWAMRGSAERRLAMAD